MPNYVLHRSYTLATSKGHRIRFEKGKPVSIPPACVPDALAIGAVPEDGSPPDVIEDSKAPAVQADPAARASDVLEAIKLICERNQRADFSAAGAPKEAAVAKLVGYEVSKAERDAAWQAYHDMREAA